MIFRIYKLGELGKVSFGMLNTTVVSKLCKKKIFLRNTNILFWSIQKLKITFRPYPPTNRIVLIMTSAESVQGA